MRENAKPELAKTYAVLSEAYSSIERVSKGLCPKCGAVREDNDCRACGHWSIYVEPFNA